MPPAASSVPDPTPLHGVAGAWASMAESSHPQERGMVAHWRSFIGDSFSLSANIGCCEKASHADTSHVCAPLNQTACLAQSACSYHSAWEAECRSAGGSAVLYGAISIFVAIVLFGLCCLGIYFCSDPGDPKKAALGEQRPSESTPLAAAASAARAVAR